MPKARPEQSFVNLLQTFEQCNIKAPKSIQLADKEDAIKLVKQVKNEGLFIGVISYDSIVDKIESEELLGFFLLGVEFWWRPSVVITEVQPGNRQTSRPFLPKSMQNWLLRSKPKNP
jgi:hypothetical protein